MKPRTSPAKRDLEPFSPCDNHWNLTLGLYRERLTRAQLKYHLLNNPDPIYCGRLLRWANRHVGAGIYEIWIEDPHGTSPTVALPKDRVAPTAG